MCAGGKHHKTPFRNLTGTRSNELLGLVHSNVCGKIGGAEYFLTFIDDKTLYVQVYTLKHTKTKYLTILLSRKLWLKSLVGINWKFSALTMVVNTPLLSLTEITIGIHYLRHLSKMVLLKGIAECL